MTKEELQEIRDYLSLFGKKDTELGSANTPFAGDESIVVVQNGQNKVAPFYRILEKIDSPLSTVICSYSEYIAFPSKSFQKLYIITDNGTETGNVIQVFLGELPIREANESVNITTDKSVIFLNIDTTVTLTATSSKNATTITIKKGNTSIANNTNTNRLSTTSIINDTTTFSVVANILGINYTKDLTIVAVNPIFYGSGSSFEDFYTYKVTSIPKTSSTGNYNVAVRNDNDYIYFAVPSPMSITKATLGGFEFPLESPVEVSIDNVTYRYYRSSNTYNHTTEPLTIIIS